MKKSLIRQLKSEDWVIVGAGAAILLLALLFPRWMPAMPKDLSSAGNWMSAGAMFLFLLVLTGVCQRILGRPLRRFAVSLLAIFGVALLSQAVASIPAIKRLGFEAVFFSVIFGLVISNFFRVPEWLKPAIQSEFYIKIGIVCLGATILFGEVLQSGVYALIQAFIVVFTVWYFAFWLARRMRVDEETSTMLASSVSICGVSAAIATCGVIRGDNKKLSYIISLVLVCAVPMMYLMPWLAGLLLPTVLSNPETVQEVAGAWMGGTIDTTGAVVASGALLGETAEQTAIIVKSSQNVLLGIAAFVISLYWSYKGQNKRQRPSVRVIWERFVRFHQVAQGFDAGEVLPKGPLVGHALLVGVQADRSGGIEPLHIAAVGHESHLSDISQQLGVESVVHRPRHLLNHPLAHAVDQKVGPAVGEDRGMERIAPVVVVGQAAQ